MISAGEPTASTKRSARELVLLGIALCLMCALLTAISRQFAEHVSGPDRPIPAMLGLLFVGFVAYLRSLRLAIRCPDGPRTIAVIVLFSAAFRGLLLCSEPIQEIDIYRYLWDGAAVSAGVNPFRYSPEQVRTLPRVRPPRGRTDPLPDDLARLVALRDSSPALATILNRVHYGELPTVYPPVSQAVFAAAVLTTPRTASVGTHIVVMKVWLLLFDLGTLGVLLLLLRQTGRPLGWAVAYGWCPLVLKEFANSGHLDAIAVFLTTAAVYAAVRAFFPHAARQTNETLHGRAAVMTGILSAALLGLGVGAKLYPVVLAPLLLVVSLRRMGWRQSVLPTVMFTAVALLTCLPMFASRQAMPVRKPTVQPAEPIALPRLSLPGQPIAADAAPQNPSRGLKTFLERWEMNDFVFMLLIENLKPPAGPDSPSSAPWFVVVPAGARQRLTEWIADRFEIDRDRVARLTARCIIGLVFAALVLILSLPRATAADSEEFLRAGFLTVAWFWLLLPTQNPWYWIWALPLIPFARRRAWLAMSGVVLLYYLRFWLSYHWPNGQRVAWGFSGTAFFDFVVTWIEFLPWFLWLAFDPVRYRSAAR